MMSMVDVPDPWEVVRWLLLLVVTRADIWHCRLQNIASRLAMFVISLSLRSWKENRKHEGGRQEVL